MSKHALSEAEAKSVRTALDCIQEAQNLVNAAARELCSLDGFGNQWRRACKLGDQIKSEWYRLEQFHPRRIDVERSQFVRKVVREVSDSMVSR